MKIKVMRNEQGEPTELAICPFSGDRPLIDMAPTIERFRISVVIKRGSNLGAIKLGNVGRAVSPEIARRMSEALNEAAQMSEDIIEEELTSLFG